MANQKYKLGHGRLGSRQSSILLSLVIFVAVIFAAIFMADGSITNSSGGMQPISYVAISGGISTFASQSSSCTVVLYLNGLDSTSTITYGTASNYTAVFTASTTGSGSAAPAITYYLYVNGVMVSTFTTGTNPTGITVLNNITIRHAGNVTVVANSSGATTNCASTHQQTINKATPTITLTANKANYTYDGTGLSFSGSVSSINNQLSGTMYIDNVTRASPYTVYSAGTYIGLFNTSGNQNYTAASQRLARQIYKATPTVSVTASRANFTYDGTAETFSGSVSSLNNQLSGTLIVDSVVRTSPYSVYSAGNYTAVFNTAGNQNYTPGSSQTLYRTIAKATPIITLTANPGNFTYNGTQERINGSLTSLNSQLTNGKLYINGVHVPSDPYFSASAETYISVYNTSGNANYSAGSLEKTFSISKASITQTLKAFPSDKYDYNKTSPTIQDDINGPNLGAQNGLTFRLYNGSVYTGLTYTFSGGHLFNFSALSAAYAQAGNYTFYSAFSGNANYSASNSSALSIEIGMIYPYLNITVVPFNESSKEKLDEIVFNISSIDNQVTGTALINGTFIGNTSSILKYNITTPSHYVLQFYTFGNTNYAPVSTIALLNETRMRYAPQPARPPTVVYPTETTVQLILLDGSYTQEKWFIYRYNDSYIRLTSDILHASSNVQIPLPKNSFALTSIALAASSPVTVPTIEISSPHSALCGTNGLTGAFEFFNSTDFLSDANSPITNISYYFEFQKSFLDERNFNSDLLTMYRCNPTTHVWYALNTTKTYDTATTIGLVGTTTMQSLYGIAFNVSTTNNSAPPEVSILTVVNTTGLPLDYAYKVSFSNSTLSAVTPTQIDFYTPTFGIYHLKTYSFSNSSFNDSMVCITTYKPNNTGSDMNTTVDAGSVFTINYSGSTLCISSIRKLTIREDIYITVIVAAISIIAILLALLIRATRRNK